MAFWSSFGLSNGMAAAAAAATVAVAGVVGFQFLGRDEPPAPVVSAPAGVTGEPADVPEEPVPETDAPVADPDAEVAASAPVASDAVAPPETAPATPIVPSFDLVRVDAAGGAVIAGRAAANADLRLRLDGQEILMANSDGTGAFVATLSIPPSDLPQILSLEMVMAGGDVLISDQSVIIQPATALAAAEPAADASPDLPDIDTDLPDLASAADTAPTGITPTGPQLGAPDSPGAAPATDTGQGAQVATAPAADAETAPVTELALLETEAPDATDPEPAPSVPTISEGTGGNAAASETPPATTGTDQGADAPEPSVATAGTQAEPTPETPQVASVAENPEAPIVTQAAPATGATPPQDTATASAQSVDRMDEGAEPQAPTVMIADAQGIRVVQSGGPAPRVQVVLDTISYDTRGEVVLTGRGPAQSDVRLYLDNQPVQLARIDTGGGWSTQLPQVDPGTYTLRVDQVSAGGDVLSRVETPFLREEPAVLQALPRRDGVSVITVQPGNTLWGIAREELGAGVLYVQVYEANRDLIRDPHWIYPGQIFAIPDRVEGQ